MATSRRNLRQMNSVVNSTSRDTVRYDATALTGWFRGAAVERWSLAGELSLSCAPPTADG